MTNFDCAVFADCYAVYADIYRVRFSKIAREIQAVERVALAHITRAGHRCDRHVS